MNGIAVGSVLEKLAEKSISVGCGDRTLPSQQIFARHGEGYSIEAWILID